MGTTNLQTATVDLDTKNAIRMQKKEEKRSKRKTLNELTALGCWVTLFEKLFIKLLLIILFISINSYSWYGGGPCQFNF